MSFNMKTGQTLHCGVWRPKWTRSSKIKATRDRADSCTQRC